MPKLVSELSQGKSYSRSSEGGQLADTATRTWKILLNTPNESFIVPDVIGVNIGDPLSNLERIPCISIDVKADGESRLVRIVTATYKTSPGAGTATGTVGDGGKEDPKLDPPTVRPAMFNISGALEETALTEYYPDSGDNAKTEVPTNPCGDRYDGFSRLVPICTISIDQYDGDPTTYIDKLGYINSSEFTFSGVPILARTCMLRNIESTPVVETWGIITYRGFKRTYQFLVTSKKGGWNLRIPVTGFRVKQGGLGSATVDSDALALERASGRVLTTLPTPTGKNYAAGTVGTYVRAMVKIPFDDGGYTQIPSAQPVALNRDGTPRLVTGSDVLFDNFRTQPEMDFGNDFSAFGIRWIF